MAEEEERRRRKEREREERIAAREGRAAATAAAAAAATGEGEGDANMDGGEGADEGGEEENDNAGGEGSGSPPALRRSGRKPLPPGTSLAITYRNTRSSPSPTPSHSSSTSSTPGPPPYYPILADLDLARSILTERAAKHWRDALAAGGGATVQGPGVNPAFAGQVMMCGTGGMMREGEVVGEFLYATKVKGESAGFGTILGKRGRMLMVLGYIDRLLKIATHPSLQNQEAVLERPAV